MGWLGKLKMLKIFIHLMLNPQRTDLLFDAIDLLSNSPDQTRIKAMEEKILAHPDFKALYEEGYIPEKPSLARLKNCAQGTFGQALYQHMASNGLDFDMWPHLETTRPIRYMTERGYFDHDLWHALLGYGIAVDDELAIQGFNVAQFGSPISLMLISGGLLKALVKNPAQAVATFNKINDGYNAGKRAKFMLGIRLHDHFDEPIDEVRRLCGIIVPASASVARPPAMASA